MDSRRPKRAIGFTFAVAVAVIAMGSAAFACTVYRGRTTVSATHPILGTTTAWNEGNNSLHGMCPTPTQVDNLTGGVSEIVTPAQPMHLVSQFTLSVGSTEVCTTESDAPDGTYDVLWLNLTDNNLLTTLNVFCPAASAWPSVDVGNLVVSGGTGGPSTFTQGTASAGDRVTICLSPGGTNTNVPSPAEVRLWMV